MRPLLRTLAITLTACASALATPGCKKDGATASAPPAVAPAARATPPAIDGPNARKLVAAGAVLVDVRSPGEFASGHIEGALNIPVNEIGARLSELPKDKPIVVYCAAGARSGVAAGTLAEAGYDVRNLGKLSAW